MRARAPRPSATTVMAAAALVVALSGPAAAALIVTGANIKDRSVRGRDIASRTITGRNIKPHSIRANQLSASVAGPRGLKGLKGDPGEPGSQGSPGETGSGAVAASGLGGAGPVRLLQEIDTSKADCGASGGAKWAPKGLPAPSFAKTATGACNVTFAADDPSGPAIKWASATLQPDIVLSIARTARVDAKPAAGGASAVVTVATKKIIVAGSGGFEQAADAQAFLAIYYDPGM